MAERDVLAPKVDSCTSCTWAQLGTLCTLDGHSALSVMMLRNCFVCTDAQKWGALPVFDNAL